MPEVLTRVDEGDSIEKFTAERRSKSQVKRIAAQQGKCSMCGENHAEATARDNAARAVAADRDRLEREVIEKAKAYGRAARAVEDHMKQSSEADDDSRAGWQLLREMESTQEDLMLQAVWPLIDFESQIKK